MISKNILGKVFVALAFLVAAVFWLLSYVMPETFGWFNGYWAVVIASGSLALFFFLKAFLGKDVVAKKFKIIMGSCFALICVGAIALQFAFPTQWYIPIIAVVVMFGILVGIIVTGGKQWDQGDNKNVGYKNYHQRKAEEEKNEKK